MTMFVPTEILMALQLATFFMPPNAIDRATYSITVNLAFTVSQQVVNNQVPTTSQTIYLFYYIVVYLVIGAAITIHTIVLTTFWQNSESAYQGKTSQPLQSATASQSPESLIKDDQMGKLDL